MNAASQARLKIAVRGAVQGVGFRPFIYRLATELGLAGWVNNSVQGVCVEVEGRRPDAEQFLLRLEAEKPPRSSIQSLEALWLESAGYQGFEIRPSETTGGKTAIVLPDLATCPDCLREILDPQNRRYRYPFTNCTHCGPRFSIIESIPYDRPNTSMSGFTMCAQCRAEYEDPFNRRFHAQPNACPDCGPHLELWDGEGNALSGGDEALRAAATAIREGKIVAVKGLGGFQLMVAASDEDALLRLRRRKSRQEKPFALMFPSLESARRICEIPQLEERLLCSPEAPIVLLRRKKSGGGDVSEMVAPRNPYLGVMLPYTPLHHLLMADLGFPVVATSGNVKDEPMAFCETDALQRLGGFAELFLVHNRPIVRHVDDSIVRVMMNRKIVLRRARGFAPLPITLESEAGNPSSVLAVGGQLKNAIALSVGPEVFISQHIGDLETEKANEAFCNIIADFKKLYGVIPEIVAADMHPDYASTRFARARADSGEAKVLEVQHHIAHVLSCMAENELAPPALGVAWDGTGWGNDGTIWGGEFFDVTTERIERVAHFRPFRLPGGERAVMEPRRSAAGLIYEMFGLAGLDRLPATVKFSSGEFSMIRTMLMRPLNAPLCCSVGRLFDAVAALAGLRQRAEFEGQAAMDLEFALGEVQTAEAYSLRLTRESSGSDNAEVALLDWAPMVESILADLRNGASAADISARFHNGLAEVVVAIARRTGRTRVALSGGCFQNRYLAERTIVRLREEGFEPCWHQRVPPNDGGIALGQIAAAWRAAT